MHQTLHRIRLTLIIVLAYVLGAATFYQLSLIVPTPSLNRLFDPDPITLHVHSIEDAERMRSALWTYLFGDTLPERASCEPTQCTVTMQNGFVSHIDVRIPESINGRLVIYHNGHAGETPADTRSINTFLENGFTVAVFDMPLLGCNAPTWVDLPDLGRILLTAHDQLQFLDTRTEGSPIRYFIEPVMAYLNTVEGQYDDITMTGVSGGGWTTTLVAALDRRIDHSYPVAGSLPMALRFARADAWGDWEQTTPELYRIADYADLYVLGAQGREQVQVLNYRDPCCFAGDHRTFYEAQTADAARALNGTFSVYLDMNNPDHSLSDTTQSWILDSLN